MEISKLAAKTSKSLIRVMYDKARLMNADDILSFTVGEPDFSAPKSIIEVANKYLNDGYTKYTPGAGIPELQDAIAEKYSPLIRPINGRNEVIVTMGGTEALLITMMTCADPGDEIIIIAPYFASYLGQVRIAGLHERIVNATEENDFVPLASQIEAAVTEKTKILLINSPCNPTGAEMSKRDLEEIARIAIKYDLFVISDEVYKFIRYDDTPYTSIASLPGMAERTIVVDSCSKTYAMPGLRVGYAIGPERIIKNMPHSHDFMVSCVNAPYQYAAAYALKNCDDDVRAMRDVFRERRDLVVEGVRSIEGLSCLEPKGAFYLFINIKQLGISSLDFCMDLLDKEHLALVPGTGFGEAGEGYVRFTYAKKEEQLKQGLERLSRYVKSVL